MQARGALALLLVGGFAAGLTAASAGEPKTVKLVRAPAAVGDCFRAEMTSKVEQITPGAAPTKEIIETKVSYVSTILSKTKSGKFETRLDMDPEELKVTGVDGAVSTEKGTAKTVTMEMTEDETRVIPTKGMATATGADVLAGRSQVTVGETWTADKKMPVGSVVDVPVHSTYTVKSIDKDAQGRDLVRIELRSEGIGNVPGSGVRIRVIGVGHVIVDALHTERPIELKLAYRFVAEGGPGADAETRSEITIKTETQKPAATKETTK